MRDLEASIDWVLSSFSTSFKKKKKNKKQGFPGGSVVKNLPANAGDMGLVLDLGRPHMPWSD